MHAIPTLLAVFLLGSIFVSLGGVVYLLYEIIKQQGRLLLRLDGIEEQLGLRGDTSEQVQSAGLAVGTEFASFKLPDLEGNEVALEDFRGERVFLVNWDPRCGYCDLIAPDLAKLQDAFQRQNVQLVLAAHDDAKTNLKLAEEHGLKCPILLQKNLETLKGFADLGTPVAYLLDERGQVARPLASGSKEVPALALEVTRDQSDGEHMRGNKPLSESRLERNGLKAGTHAPAFRLPDIHGREVSLDQFRGRRLLLVFSDPHCGPCDHLAPHLARIHREHLNNNLAVVMVGRGEPEENRRKAEQHGIEFPVVLQEKWELSKEYGIFETPVAFLIGADGVIAKGVARGAEEVIQLVEDPSEAEED